MAATSFSLCSPRERAMQRCRTQQPWHCIPMSRQWTEAASKIAWRLYNVRYQLNHKPCLSVQFDDQNTVQISDKWKWSKINCSPLVVIQRSNLITAQLFLNRVFASKSYMQKICNLELKHKFSLNSRRNNGTDLSCISLKHPVTRFSTWCWDEKLRKK